MSEHIPGRILKASSRGEAVSVPRGAAVPREGARAKSGATILQRLLSNLPVILIYVFLVAMTIFALFPVYYVLQASLAGDQNLYTTTLQLLPSHPTFSNFVYAFTQLPLLNWMLNTTIVCGLATLIGVVFAMTGAYALSRFRFRGREASLSFLLALQAFPGLLAITAYYYLLSDLHLLNTVPLIGLALIYAAGNLAFGTWNIKGYFDTIPVALEQAAMIDGATQWQAFWRVLLPLSTPALAASALFMFVGGWNEFALANFILTANSNGSNLTFILGLNALQGTYTTPWGYFAATAVIISVPLMLLFLYARRYFQSGLTIGGVKE